MSNFDNRLSLVDLKEFYLKKESNETFAYLKQLVMAYYGVYLQNNFQLSHEGIFQQENEIQFNFNVKYNSIEITLDFIFTKNFDYQRELIVPNIFLGTYNKKNIEVYKPKNRYNLAYLPRDRTISFLIVSTTPIGLIKDMKCVDIFEIGLHILLQRTQNTLIN
ncbi:MAG: hypothetical protein LAT82_03200 [Nanoarchaeota archaeon]|nr:hypothetical protein [Nanoarchaeota archaeon]